MKKGHHDDGGGNQESCGTCRRTDDPVNDTDKDAAELSDLLKGLNAVVNLIPVNPIKERDYKETAHADVLAFKNKLEKSGINVTIRREMGRDIDGACGQLRKKVLSENHEEA